MPVSRHDAQQPARRPADRSTDRSSGQPARRPDPAHGPAVTSSVWPDGGRHLWRPGGVSALQSHDRGHLVYAATGVLAVRTAGGTSVVPANRVAWTPAGIEHRHQAHGATDMRIVFLAPSVARHLPDRPAVFLASDLAREVLLALTAHDGHVPPERSPAARDRLVRVLVDELTEAREEPLHLPEPRDDRLREVARLLAEDPSDASSLTELGHAVGASARTLSRLLSTELGTTFYAWRTQLRVYHALVLLAEGRDVTWTAHACGWSNPSAFIAAFTALTGTTPGRHRAGVVGPPARAVSPPRPRR